MELFCEFSCVCCNKILYFLQNYESKGLLETITSLKQQISEAHDLKSNGKLNTETENTTIKDTNDILFQQAQVCLYMRLLMHHVWSWTICLLRSNRPNIQYLFLQFAYIQIHTWISAIHQEKQNIVIPWFQPNMDKRCFQVNQTRNKKRPVSTRAHFDPLPDSPIFPPL